LGGGRSGPLGAGCRENSSDEKRASLAVQPKDGLIEKGDWPGRGKRGGRQPR